jgi:hypothetical protein
MPDKDIKLNHSKNIITEKDIRKEKIVPLGTAASNAFVQRILPHMFFSVSSNVTFLICLIVINSLLHSSASRFCLSFSMSSSAVSSKSSISRAERFTMPRGRHFNYGHFARHGSTRLASAPSSITSVQGRTTSFHHKPHQVEDSINHLRPRGLKMALHQVWAIPETIE